MYVCVCSLCVCARVCVGVTCVCICVRACMRALRAHRINCFACLCTDYYAN